MNKLLYFIGILCPLLCPAQQNKVNIIPASDKHEYNVYYVDETGARSEVQKFNEKCFGGFLVAQSASFKKDLKATTDKFWLWFAFGITSIGIIGLLLVFNKLKKNFNDTY